MGSARRLLRGALGFGQVALLVPEVGEALLQVQRHGVVDLGADACGHEVLAQLVPVARADHVLIVDVAHALGGTRRLDRLARDRPARKARVVEGGVALPARAPVIQMLQLHVEHRGLDLIEAEIAADERVVVLRLAAVHAQDFQALGERGIVGHAHAGIAECAEVLGGKERKAADVAEAAAALALRIFRADRLRGIFDHLQAVSPRDLHERAHVGDLAVELHRHQRLDHCRRSRG